jgi:hypothetical protein
VWQKCFSEYFSSGPFLACRNGSSEDNTAAIRHIFFYCRNCSGHPGIIRYFKFIVSGTLKSTRTSAFA